jgi:hypothetical protein
MEMMVKIHCVMCVRARRRAVLAEVFRRDGGGVEVWWDGTAQVAVFGDGPLDIFARPPVCPPRRGSPGHGVLDLRDWPLVARAVHEFRRTGKVQDVDLAPVVNHKEIPGGMARREDVQACIVLG